MEEILRIRSEMEAMRNRAIDLSPLDLYHMSTNSVVLDSDENTTILRCMSCNFRANNIDTMVNHCGSNFHFKNLNDYTEERSAVDPVERFFSFPIRSQEEARFSQPKIKVPDRDVVASILRRDSGGVPVSSVLERFVNATPVNEYICELCQIYMDSEDSFFLHWTGFGHAQRVGKIRQAEQEYLQAFQHPLSNEVYVVGVTDLTILQQIHDVQTSAEGNVFGYSNVSRISRVHPVIFNHILHSPISS